MSYLRFFILFHIIKQFISSPFCKQDTNFCNHCNILTNLCAKCVNSEVLIPDENGGCTGIKKCTLGKNNCYECDINGKLCKTCEKNYYPDENGGCTYSGECEISYKGECIKCKNGFFLIGRKNELRICKSIDLDIYKNCKEINYETGFCIECKEGYYLGSGDHKCVKTENCKESVFGNCILCNNGYYYNRKEDNCKLKQTNFTFCKESNDDKNCDICEDGTFFDKNGICCYAQFCLESDNLKCQKCISGYYLVKDYSSNLCTNTDNCYTVDKITSICTHCKSNYYLDTMDYKCKSNLEDNPYKYCKKVENGACINCELNYYLGEDSKCTNTPNCIESENGKCEKCAEDYHLGLDNICTNVEKCIRSKFTSCIECEDGYYYDTTNKTCKEAKGQFSNCKYSCSYDKDKCCECKDNYYLFEEDSLCYDNTKEELFIKCAIVDYSKERCNKCVDGYYLGLNDNKCSIVENCKIVENENKCFECDTFYCLDVKNQKCVDNDYLSDNNDKIHISCNRTNEEGTTCEQCINGYELNEMGYCVDIDFCEEKKDGKCLKCKDIISENGYEFCANEIFGCLDNSIDNCLRCDNLNDLYSCTECKKGYKLTTNGCEKSE